MTPAYTLWDHVFRQLSACIYAEQVFCSITTEMKYLPAFKHVTALGELHKENYETSYHQNTAAGNLQRLMMGAKTAEQDKVLTLITIACLTESKEHQTKAATALSQISADTEHQAWLEAALHWHRMRKHWLKAATKTLHAAMPPEWWQQGEELAQSRH